MEEVIVSWKEGEGGMVRLKEGEGGKVRLSFEN